MSRRLVVASTVVLAALVAATAAAPSSGQCRPFSGTAHDAAASPAGPYVGIADFTIGGTAYSDVVSVTNVVAPLTPAGHSGVLFTATSHTFSAPALGTITTQDAARLIPTQVPGVYRLETHLLVVGGARGELHLSGTVNLATLTASGSYSGAICGLS